ncbi:MAG: DUF2889 domain-containing protein [Gammaproteobacteria bacterium]|nr:DUF2889 domain-containing protein [Gammaproteobacteria bacterium]
MPLSEPVGRELLHTRKVTCAGYRRHDGLYDIEGSIVDTKSYDFDNRDRGGRIHAGEPLHEMHVRLTLDLDMVVHDAEAVTEWAPYHVCSNAAASIKNIIGLQIGPGWRGRVNRALGKATGCTHITELLGPMATTAYQTMVAEMQKRSGPADDSQPPRQLNACFAYADDGPVVKREWPRWYRGGDKPV